MNGNVVESTAVHTGLKIPGGAVGVIDAVLTGEGDVLDRTHFAAFQDLLCPQAGGPVTQIQHTTDFQIFFSGKPRDLL